MSFRRQHNGGVSRTAVRYFLGFLLRVSAAAVLIGAFFVAVQDFLILPAVIRPLFGAGGEPPPPGVEAAFVKTGDGEQIDLWRVPGAPPGKGPVVIFHGNADTVQKMVRLQRFLAKGGHTSYIL